MIVCANQNKMCIDEVGNGISRLCTGQTTKNMLVNGSAEPVGAHWIGEKTNG